MDTAYRVATIRDAESRAARTVGWDALMQRAADELAVIVGDLIEEDARTVFLIGPGNNGGDALFAAARLSQQGIDIDLCLLDPDKTHSAGLAAALAAGARQIDEPGDHTVAVDGLFGIGARGGLTGRAAAWAQWRGERNPFTIAVDVPSGIGVDDGTLPGTHFRADATVTFGAYKPGLLLGPAADAAGDVILADIGLSQYFPAMADVETITADDLQLLAPALPTENAHKYTRGVVGIRAGSPDFPGAAHLAVAGAQAGPAGYIRYLGDAAVARRIIDRAPEVVAGAGRVQAWVVGPGGGADIGEQLQAALADEVPMVIDAAALDHLPALSDLGPRAVITPHAGELAWLLDTGRVTIEADPLRHARLAAERWNCTVLLKGHRTLIVTNDQPTRANRSGTAWLGTAGSGDVLSGFIGSLLAAGLPAHDAASVGAYLHGCAGVLANPGGPVTASQVAAALSGVVADFITGLLETERDW